MATEHIPYAEQRMFVVNMKCFGWWYIDDVFENLVYIRFRYLDELIRICSALVNIQENIV